MVEQKSNDVPKIIAAIPCLNEEAFIGDIVTRAKKYIDKVIVVDYYGGNKFWGKSNLAHLFSPKVSSGIFTVASVKTSQQSLAEPTTCLLLGGIILSLEFRVNRIGIGLLLRVPTKKQYTDDTRMHVVTQLSRMCMRSHLLKLCL